MMVQEDGWMRGASPSLPAWQGLAIPRLAAAHAALKHSAIKKADVLEDK